MNGRLVQIGLIGGSRAQMNLTPILQSRLTVTGSTLRAAHRRREGCDRTSGRAAVWPLLDSGTVKPIVHATFPLARAADAHRLLESGEVIGKVVLTTGQP